MRNFKILPKSVKKIQRNTIQNQRYKARVKTFTKKCLVNIKNYKVSRNNFTYFLIFRNFNLAFSSLDKCLHKNILNKRIIAKKKSKLHFCVNQII